ncbi:MAG: hypothetical protein ASARMPRED_007590 [Alectoria sarmentosa]|nr:MAG: hypothetical protein ASARMPRED_007590 [Alectoria sarmentosa]
MMAKRNIYDGDVDFAVLALQSPAFNKHLKSNGQLDFSNPEAVQQLTKSLLERDFAIKLDLPDDRLCPPVPNRFNYIVWIQDLLDTTGDSYADRYDAERTVTGFDMDGSKLHLPFAWLFSKAEVEIRYIDEKNMTYAKRNILQNNLKSRIRPLQTKPNDPLIPLAAFGLESIDFTICNPPFYASTSDLLSSAAAKSRPPRSACTGADVEMVTPGGEIAFVSRMIDESKILKDSCQWYTSMLGKYSSVEVIIENLRGAGVENWAVKDLVQGNKTRRWAVAWSWGSMRPSHDVARGTSTLPKHLLPFFSESSFNVVEMTIESCSQRLNTTLQALGLRWQYRPIMATGVGFADGNVWSRAARRKQQQSPTNSTDKDQAVDQEDEDGGPALGFKIQLRQETEGVVQVMVRWLQGRDSVLFESFCGMLKRQLKVS